MTPFFALTFRAAALAGLVVGLSAMMPAQAQVYRCNEHGQTTYSDHPCGTRATSVPLIDNTPSAADQKAALDRASNEAAQVHEMETARRKAQAAEDARQAQIAAQAAEQARREQQRKVVVAQEGVRYCHRVYIGPAPYPLPYPTPMPVITQPPAPPAGACVSQATAQNHSRRHRLHPHRSCRVRITRTTASSASRVMCMRVRKTCCRSSKRNSTHQ